MRYENIGLHLASMKLGSRQWRRLATILCVFVLSVLLLDQLGVFLKIGEERLSDPGYEYPMRGDHFDDLLPVNHIYDQLVFRIHNNTSCKGSLRLAIFVKSAVAHGSRRAVIRRTWGKQRFSNVDTRTFFVVGRASEEEEVLKENDKYGDILQVDFVDHYYNNTLKMMSSIRWATQFCRSTQYFLFIDDDYYLSVKNLLRFVNVFEAESGGLLYAGTLFPNSAPMRHRFSKWFISLKEYPFSVYPPYITAGAILMNQEGGQKIYAASKYTYHFKFDDIYVGICARKARVPPKHSDYVQMSAFYGDMKDMIAVHGYTESELDLKWNLAYRNGFA